MHSLDKPNQRDRIDSFSSLDKETDSNIDVDDNLSKDSMLDDSESHVSNTQKSKDGSTSESSSLLGQ